MIRKFDNTLLQCHYSQDSIYRYRKVLKEFEEYANNNFFSPEISARFLIHKFKKTSGFITKGKHSKKQLYYIRTIRSLEYYYLFGSFNRKTHKNRKIIWPIQFRKPIEAYIEQLQINGRTKRYIEIIILNLNYFLLYLNKFDINTFSDITQTHVSGYIASLIGYAPRTVAAKISILRGLFKYMYLYEFLNKPLANALPKVHGVARINVPTIWSQSDIQKIKNVIDISNPSGKRDYAIILLVARTGLRSGDVINLKLSDINWYKKEIILTQSKTKETLCLPLMDDVGWAIIDYLKTGRPITAYKNVFVRHLAPFEPITSSATFYGMITRYIAKAGLPIKNKSRIGIHSLRHSLASELLQNNVEINVIADILGHSDPETTRHYLSVNLKALRQCPLEVFGGDYE